MKQGKHELECCMLCPRACGVNRLQGQLGICGQSSEVKVARADLHMWEEPCLSGSRGSGAVFFSGCNLHCVFCQNHSIASGNAGKIISADRLSEIFLELQEKGANNINLVTGTHFVPQIIKALEKAWNAGLKLPIVYNSSGYETVETIRMLDGYVDIYLPDFKYADSRLSRRYSSAPDYFERAAEAVGEMVRQIGEMQFAKETPKADAVQDSKAQQESKIDVEEYQRRSESGESLVMTRGVIVRHLLLPGEAEDSKRVIAYLLKEYGSRIFISMMNQYTPLLHAAGYENLQRRVSAQEYEELIDHALELGIENGFIQDGDTAQESFIPEFDGKGV